jgi:tRNA pseudouridine55 synthase
MNSRSKSDERREKAVVNGLLLLNKPPGMSSNQALQKVKRLLRAKKAGHTGSLDPAATGMLPLCFGEATKVSAYLLDADKTYRVTARLGLATDTGDAVGSVIESAAVPERTHAAWEATLASYLGDSEQVPPMYSALKKDGKRLYELARKGETVERQPRPIRILDIGLLELRGDRIVFRVRCTKGTYVRTLVEDIARSAGTVAHTASLHRETVAGFRAEDMLDMQGTVALVETGSAGLEGRLLPPDAALAGWRDCHVGVDAAARFCGGQAVDSDLSGEGLVRVYDAAGAFLGVGDLVGDGSVAPKRIFQLANATGN